MILNLGPPTNPRLADNKRPDVFELERGNRQSIGRAAGHAVIQVKRISPFYFPNQKARLMKRIAIMIDGGHLRESVDSQYKFNVDFIEEVALKMVETEEELLRVLFYDCDPYRGNIQLPVSGKMMKFDQPGWLDALASKELFAVRRGVLKFRGFKLKGSHKKFASLSEDDLKPDLLQKGVDMRLGIDIANFSITKAVERIILVSRDTDCVPAMKYCRIAGIQVYLAQFPGQLPVPELSHHADGYRKIPLSDITKKFKAKSRSTRQGGR